MRALLDITYCSLHDESVWQCFDLAAIEKSICFVFGRPCRGGRLLRDMKKAGKAHVVLI